MIYILEDLENSLKIKQDTVAFKFRGNFNFIIKSYEGDLTKLIDIKKIAKSLKNSELNTILK